MSPETRKHTGPSIADAIPAELPEMPERPGAKRPKVAAESAPPKHHHPRRYRLDFVGFDDNGKRMMQSVEDYPQLYRFDCPACIVEDKARMAAPFAVSPEDCERTVFLIPELEYDRDVCSAYLRSRVEGNDEYEGVKLNITPSFNAVKLSYVADAQFVVLTRRGTPAGTYGPRWESKLDVHGQWKETQIPPAAYIHEVVESAPIVLADCIHIQPAAMFTEHRAEMGGLMSRLNDVCFPFFIQEPADKADTISWMRR